MCVSGVVERELVLRSDFLLPWVPLSLKQANCTGGGLSRTRNHQGGEVEVKIVSEKYEHGKTIPSVPLAHQLDARSVNYFSLIAHPI